MRLLGIGKNLPSKHIVTVDVQGDHGTIPPEKELEETVRDWLCKLITDKNEAISYQLQVECRRIPSARNFYGVNVVCLPKYNPSSVEIRVRPKGNTHQWKCHLVCPTQELAEDIHDRARPNSIAYISRCAAEDSKKKKTEDKNPIAQLPRNKLKRLNSLNQSLRLIRQMKKLASLQRLCHSLRQAVALEIIQDNILRREISAVLDQLIPSESYQDLIIILVEDGVIEPAGLGEVKSFKQTTLFDEYVEAFESNRSQKLREGLFSRQQLLAKFRLSANSERERLMAKVDQATKQIEELDDRIRDITATLEQLN